MTHLSLAGGILLAIGGMGFLAGWLSRSLLSIFLAVACGAAGQAAALPERHSWAAGWAPPPADRSIRCTDAGSSSRNMLGTA